MLPKLYIKKLRKKLGLIISICFLYFFYPNYNYAQTISGTIENIYGEKIPIVNIVIKDSIDIIEFTIGRNGRYKIDLTKDYTNLVIEITAPRYIKDTLIIRNPIKTVSYTRNIILQKDTILTLNEVTVVAKPPAFVIKKDTLNYNVASYSDGTERKIVDIIKKLPGIDVNDKTGEILYKGKSIETVRLEGEDLFGSNYSIGTKNINVDIVDQVQAIENYSDNPLLKGIEGGERVALNLKLKKDKIDLSGSVDVGVGVADPEKAISNISANILGISKKYKSFSTISYNNIGINNSPFDYFSPNSTVEQLKESELYARKLIPESTFFSGLDNLRVNSNNELFINYNNAFKISKKINTKVNIYYLSDKINFDQGIRNYNSINGDQITTSDNYRIVKKPTQYRADVEIKDRLSDLTLIEYRCKISEEQINTLNNVTQNDTLNYKTNLASANYLIKQSLVITHKISDKKAVQIFVNQSLNDIPQRYNLYPFTIDSITNISANQSSDFKKNVLSVRSVILAKPTANSKYSFSIGGYVDVSSLDTKLSNDGTSFNEYPSFLNEVNYQKKVFDVSGRYELSVKKWKFATSFFLSYLLQNFDNILFTKHVHRENLLFEPNFTSIYNVNTKSILLATVSYKQKPLVDEYLFNNYIIQSNRIIANNIPSLDFQKNTSFSVFYMVNDLYRHFRLNLGANYITNRGNYFSDISLNKTVSQISQFYLPEPMNNMSFNFLIEKYIPILESTLRIKSDYSILNYRNIINNSELRDNKSQSLSTEVFLKTAFNKIINFENVFIYIENNSRSNTNSTFKNNSIHNIFKVIVKPRKDLFALLSSEYYLPSIQNNTAFFFADATIRYKPTGNLFSFEITGRNITNNKFLTQVNTSDFSVNYLGNSLIPRYIIINVSRNF